MLTVAIDFKEKWDENCYYWGYFSLFRATLSAELMHETLLLILLMDKEFKRILKEFLGV